MAGGKTLVIVALSGVALASAALSAEAQPRSYTVAATETCLRRLPGVIAGLPPATPPTPPVLFVYRAPHAHLAPPAVGMLVAITGRGKQAAYDAVTFTFFESARKARQFAKAQPQGEAVDRNVVVSWDHRPGRETSWRTAVRACLRGGSPPASGAIPRRAIPHATLATFEGYWGGHTRGLRITPDGRGHEEADDGCCTRLYRLNFRILAVAGTLTRATATYRVTSFKHYRYGPTLHAGQVGKLLLKNGIVSNPLTKDYFCSDPAWGATGACGA